MSVINWPILYIPDPTKGRPLFSGQIFVGEPDTDPQVAINQKQLNVIEENGTVVSVSQPFPLSAGGVPVYNGNPVRLDVDGNYSIKILNKLGAQVYYIENVFEGQPVTELDLINDLSQAYEFDNVQAMKDSTITFPSNKVLNTKSYYSGWAALAKPIKSGAEYRFLTNAEASSASVDIDGWGNHQLVNGVAVWVGTVYRSVEWGVVADGLNDDTIAQQQILDSAGQSPVELAEGVTRCGGLTTRTSIFGSGMINSFLLDKDGVAPVLTLLGGTKALYFRDFRINGLGQGTGEAFKIGSPEGNVNDMDFSNIYIKGFERGLFSIDGEEVWGCNFQGIRIDETDYAYEFLGNTTGYTTINFTECYATISKIGFNLQVFEVLTMTDCGSDAATDTPFNFNYCRGAVINGIYIENCVLSGSTPNLVKTFNCEAFAMDGFILNSNTAANPIYMFQVNGSGKNVTLKNGRVKNMTNQKLLEVGASCTKENTNLTISGFDDTEVLFSGDAKIRMPDFENIALIQNTNSNGRITVTYADYDIPDWLGKYPTTGLGISTGAVQPYFLSNYLFSSAFTCDVFNGVDGTNVNTADIPVVVNLTCRRI